MLIMMNQYLMNFIFNMKKALNDQNSPNQISVHPIFQCYLGNSTLINACFPLFSLFHFKL